MSQSASTLPRTRLIETRALLPLGLAVAVVALVLCLMVSIALGAAEISVSTVFQAFFAFDAELFDP